MDKSYDIVAIGDSITWGFPFSEKHSWVNIISEKFDLKIKNRGINGNLTSDMYNRFVPHVVTERPRAVIILGGYNDAFCGVSPEKVALNFQKMYGEAQNNNIKTIFGLPTPVAIPSMEFMLGEYRDWISNYAQEEGIGLIDFYHLFLDPSTKGPLPGLTVDGAHPSIEGYEVMARAVDPNLLAPKKKSK